MLPVRGNAGTEEAKFREAFSSVSLKRELSECFINPDGKRITLRSQQRPATCISLLPRVWAPRAALVSGPWSPKEVSRSEGASETEQQAGQPAGGAGRARAGPVQARTEAAGFIYLGGWRRGGLAVGGLRAKAGSFGDGGGRGWVLGRSWGADYDRGGHGQVGALRGEGLLAPLLKRAAHTGLPGCPADLQPPTPRPRPH